MCLTHIFNSFIIENSFTLIHTWPLSVHDDAIDNPLLTVFKDTFTTAIAALKNEDSNWRLQKVDKYKNILVTFPELYSQL